jgi:uncharacterized membrane protein YdjX (TVP38/TMEM64 family)
MHQNRAFSPLADNRRRSLVLLLLAAASAMLAFVSSAAFVPIAALIWGQAISVVLLWLGWALGGVLSFSMNRLLGRQVVYAIAPRALLERYESLLTHQPPFGLVLLLQLALPSEVPGYLLGLIRYPFWKYLFALLLAEFPYALATVLLGSTCLERRTVLHRRLLPPQ